MQCGVAMGLSLRVFQVLTSHSLTLCLFSACAPGHDACVHLFSANLHPAKLWLSVDGRECEKMQKNDVKRHCVHELGIKPRERRVSWEAESHRSASLGIFCSSLSS